MPPAFDWSDFAKRRTGSPEGRRELAVVLLGDFMRWPHGLDLTTEQGSWSLQQPNSRPGQTPSACLDFDSETITLTGTSERHHLTWHELANEETSRDASLLLERRLGLASPAYTPLATPRVLAYKTAAELIRQHPGRPGEIRLIAVTAKQPGGMGDVTLDIGSVSISTTGHAETIRGTKQLMELYDAVGRNLSNLVESLTRYGHLFVAHSHLETVGCTAVVIPTDSRFSVNPNWKLAANVPAHVNWSALKPAGWQRGSVIQLHPDPKDAKHPDVWMIDSIANTPAEVGDLVSRVVATIVKSAGPALREQAKAAGLRLPLIAFPMVGSGHGGHTNDRGRLAEALITGLSAAAANHGVDIVLVTASRSDYGVLQQIRRQRVDQTSFPDLLGPALIRQATGLGLKVANQEVALFFGAGLSMGAGLPSWSGLLQKLLTESRSELTWEEVSTLPVLDQGEVIERELRHLVRTAGDADSHETLGERITRIVSEVRRPGLGHVLLAGMQVPTAVTTNYDQLYERAVEATGGVDDTRTIAVLPWDRAEAAGPWVLKMHGDIKDPGSIVLTRDAFVHYDSRWKPVGAVVQALMMTKHLMIVGASLTDDNLIRFAHEVAGLRRQLAPVGHPNYDSADIGTVISLSPDRAFERLWSNQLDVVVAGSAPSVASSGYPPVTRALSIFLDAVAMYAAQDASHLLDARYQVRDSHLVHAARELYAAAYERFHEGDAAWGALARALAKFGAAEESEAPAASFLSDEAGVRRSRARLALRTRLEASERGNEGTESVDFGPGYVQWVIADEDHPGLQLEISEGGTYDEPMPQRLVEQLTRLGWNAPTRDFRNCWLIASDRGAAGSVTLTQATDLILGGAQLLGLDAEDVAEAVFAAH